MIIMLACSIKGSYLNKVIETYGILTQLAKLASVADSTIKSLVSLLIDTQAERTLQGCYGSRIGERGQCGDI
jgi:hypothetical protein